MTPTAKTKVVPSLLSERTINCYGDIWMIHSHCALEYVQLEDYFDELLKGKWCLCHSCCGSGSSVTATCKFGVPSRDLSQEHNYSGSHWEPEEKAAAPYDTGSKDTQEDDDRGSKAKKRREAKGKSKYWTDFYSMARNRHPNPLNQ